MSEEEKFGVTYEAKRYEWPTAWLLGMDREMTEEDWKNHRYKLGRVFPPCSILGGTIK
jgi:hypothetical protein